MAYCTVDDVRAVLSAQGVSDTASAASLSDDDLQAAIDDTSSEVDARLAVRYDVPFDDDRETEAKPVPRLVRNITRDIAAYKATLTYRRGAPLETTDPAQLRYNAATKLLSLVVNGQATLGLENSPSEDQPSIAREGATYNRNIGPMFGPEELGIGPAILRPRRDPMWDTY